MAVQAVYNKTFMETDKTEKSKTIGLFRFTEPVKEHRKWRMRIWDMTAGY